VSGKLSGLAEAALGRFLAIDPAPVKARGTARGSGRRAPIPQISWTRSQIDRYDQQGLTSVWLTKR